MNRNLLLLQRLFREVFDDASLVLHAETRQADIEGWDSVAQVKLVLALEEALNTRLTDTDISTLISVAAFLGVMEQVDKSDA